MRLGVSRVRDARAGTLNKQFSALHFNDGETVDEFAIRITGFVNQLALLGKTIPESDAVHKFLEVVPRKYMQIAMSIETLVDLNTLSIEELVGRLKAAEEPFGLDKEGTSGGQLLLTEEEWQAHSKGRASGDSDFGGSGGGGSSGGGSGGGERPRDKGHDRNKDGTRRDGSSSGASKDDVCRYCGKKGHWARECRKKKREEAHLARSSNSHDGHDDDPTLLMSVVTAASIDPENVGGQVFLNEAHAEATLGTQSEPCDGRWYLDTGASNHMSGDRATFAPEASSPAMDRPWRSVGVAPSRSPFAPATSTHSPTSTSSLDSRPASSASASWTRVVATLASTPAP
jgi:hypothetical protein